MRVSLSGPSGQAVKVGYATASGSALSGKDFVPASGTLVFPEGTTTGELALAVVGDLALEANEAFTVGLKLPENATLATAQATVSILDDDALPALSVGDVWTKEGQAGTHDAVFRVSLSAAAPADVSVLWATADATAKAGEDYLPGGGTLTIAKGRRVGTLRVTIVGDQTDERNEAFLLSLSGPDRRAPRGSPGPGRGHRRRRSRRLRSRPSPAFPTRPRARGSTGWPAT